MISLAASHGVFTEHENGSLLFAFHRRNIQAAVPLMSVIFILSLLPGKITPGSWNPLRVVQAFLISLIFSLLIGTRARSCSGKFWKFAVSELSTRNEWFPLLPTGLSSRAFHSSLWPLLFVAFISSLLAVFRLWKFVLRGTFHPSKNTCNLRSFYVDEKTMKTNGESETKRRERELALDLAEKVCKKKKIKFPSKVKLSCS